MLEPRLETSTEQSVKLGAAAARRTEIKTGAVLTGYQSRVDLQAARLNAEIVVAAAEYMTAILHDAEAATFGPIVRGQLLEPDHAMSDAVRRLVIGFSGEVVQRQDGRSAPRK